VYFLKKKIGNGKFILSYYNFLRISLEDTVKMSYSHFNIVDCYM